MKQNQSVILFETTATARNSKMLSKLGRNLSMECNAEPG